MPKLKGTRGSKPLFNIHTVTTEIEYHEKEHKVDRDKAILLSKNVEAICIKCGHKWFTAFYTLNGVRCPLCRHQFKLNWLATNIRDSTLTDKELRIEGEYRIGGIRLRRRV